MNSSNDYFSDVIFSYMRQQAIEDGELVNVSSSAKEAGFKLPVAVSRAVWHQFIEWTSADDDKQTVQHESGRLWDVLWMLSLACRRCAGESSLKYRLYVIPRDGRSRLTRAYLGKLRESLPRRPNQQPIHRRLT
jgi:hypothetical protein